MEDLMKKVDLLSARILRFVTNANKTGKESRTRGWLSARMELLESYWSNYLTNHNALIDIADPVAIKSNAYFKNDVFSDIECAYIDAKAWVEDQLTPFSIAQETVHEILNSTPVNALARTTLQMPKVDLPKFSGSIMEWPSFQDKYLALVHNSEQLSKTEKMHYLKASVFGEASKLIQNFSVTEANYESAWNALVDRYDNKRILVNSHLHSLVTLAPMSSESSAELRRVLDNFNQAVGSLQNLKRPTGQWDDWFVYFLSSKLETSLRKDWENSIVAPREIPFYKDLYAFLSNRLQSLSAMKELQAPRHRPPPQLLLPNRTPKQTSRIHHNSNKRCPVCLKDHFIYGCPNFKAKSLEERIKFLKNKKLCSNCLRPNHEANSCPSTGRCKDCNERHHSLLHRSSDSLQISHADPSSSSLSVTTTAQTVTQSNVAKNLTTLTQRLLATAVITVESPNGTSATARALVDPGSESSYITTKLAHQLALPTRKTSIQVLGVAGCLAGTANAIAFHHISSAHNPQWRFPMQSLVLPTLTQLIPSTNIQVKNWPHILGIPLADPDFNKPGNIDVILGVGMYANILLEGIRIGPPGTPVAQATSLGWILFGELHQNSVQSQLTASCLHSSTAEVDTFLRRFWEIEEPPQANKLTTEDAACEAFFKQTHSRDSAGRYIIQYPFKTDHPPLGNSYRQAINSLLHLENRFKREPDLFKLYSKFIQDYINLKHMELVPDNEIQTYDSYFIPHHAVFKRKNDDPSKLDIRVVFDASRKTSTGISFNDIVHVGPKLQNDIFQVFLKWRVWPYVFVADIEKMFRQILVDRKDINWLKILWRFHPTDPVRCYRLLTVTYGTACAPYLACRVRDQLADDYTDQFPEASRVVKDNSYVDDFLFGAFDKDSAYKLRKDIERLLQQGCFHLHKWLSNDPTLLADLPKEDCDEALLKILSDSQIKTLGIAWNPSTDVFQFCINLPHSTNITKRTTLSDISKIYDPLGWLGPATIKAKIFIQKLWLEKLEWDDPLPSPLLEEWQGFRQDLTALNTIQIHRWIGMTNSYIGIELHGFCDASLSAYAAVLYLRVVHSFDNIQISLLCAKTRVSPLKTVSLPRLELCGAALLADLANKVQNTLNMPDISTHLWTDSTIVLAWLREHPSKWNVFVANRVSSIHQLQPNARWHHVVSKDNPADCASRGIAASELENFTLWWSSPPWLRLHSSNWPSLEQPLSELDFQTELRTTSLLSNTGSEPEFSLIHRYSKLSKLIRITAYCIRFLHNSLAKFRAHTRDTGLLTLMELNSSLNILIKIVQSSYFSGEIKGLLNEKQLTASSKIQALAPFLDCNQILRVGGRLKNALISYDEKFPVILPKYGHFTTLVIRDAHHVTLHGGVQATLQQLRARYWIIGGRNTVRNTIRSCIICCRHRAKTQSQLMGDLPSDRVIPSKPFLHSGVDYAGPFFNRVFRSRGKLSIKTYVAVFICFVTRAVHLELVMDLTSEAFIAAFIRFTSRRGRCAKLYSDNATNFVAADKQLRQWIKHLQNDQHMTQSLLEKGTEWHFIPPVSPHFGGLWEAAVKSMKYHLRRVIGPKILTVEEMHTLLAQIEASLNSRPLCALSESPDDFSVLTPGHFLVGERLLTPPAPSTLSIPQNRLSRWQLVQNMHEHIWRRWYKDYLSMLQVRQKWKTDEPPLTTNDLVLLVDDSTPPSRWLLGRVIECHSGTDNRTRVVTVQTSSGTLKRSIVKLIKLPIEKGSN